MQKRKAPKRDISREIMASLEEMRAHREGRITLRTFKREPAPLPKVDAKVIESTRKKLHMSRGVFARQLRVNARTLERWEQGRSKPNDQAAALILLVRRYPDTLERLQAIGR